MVVRKQQSPLVYLASGFSTIIYSDLPGFMADGHTLCPADINRVYLYISFQGFFVPVLMPRQKAVATGGFIIDTSIKSLELFVDKHYTLVQDDWHTDGSPVGNAFCLGIVKN